MANETFYWDGLILLISSFNFIMFELINWIINQKSQLTLKFINKNLKTSIKSKKQATSRTELIVPHRRWSVNESLN